MEEQNEVRKRMSSVETTDQQREEAENTSFKHVLILDNQGIVNNTFKYLVLDKDKTSDKITYEFILQTKKRPEYWLEKTGFELTTGKEYLIPMRQPRGKSYYNAVDKFISMAKEYAEGKTSTIPLEEQGGNDDMIKKITEGDKPQLFPMTDPIALDKPVKSVVMRELPPLPPRNPIPPATDKPITKDSNFDETVRGSQLAVVTEFLPSEIEVLNYIKMYNFVKQNVVNESDYQKIGNKKFLKKSGFRKFIQAFKLSLEILEKTLTDGELGIEYEVVARCTAPNGQFVDAVAICQQREKDGNRSKHDTLTTAMTRAKSRAISDLVAFGEVSAEEAQ